MPVNSLLIIMLFEAPRNILIIENVLQTMDAFRYLSRIIFVTFRELSKLHFPY